MVGLSICTAGFTAALFERNHREGCSFRNSSSNIALPTAAFSG